MKQRPLGSTGISVSPIGLGTVKLGRDQQVKYPRGFTIPDDKSVREILALARELGINLIDTAPAYGNSEERLGQLDPGLKDWVVVTKVGEIFEHGESRFDFSAVHTRMSVQRSLRRLKRDYLDVVLVHSHGEDMQIIDHEEVFDELRELKREGLVRAFGMSSKTEQGGLWVVNNCDLIMATCNRSDTHDLPVIAEAARLNKGVLVKKGLQSGHVAGGGGVEDAIRYVFSHAGISSMIVGTINPRHLRENIRMFEAIENNA